MLVSHLTVLCHVAPFKLQHLALDAQSHKSGLLIIVGCVCAFLLTST